MKSSKVIHTAWALGLLSLLSIGGYVWAQQGPGFGPPGGGPPPGGGGGFEEEDENPEPLPPPKVVTEEKDGYRYITSNGIANHVTGQFPGPGNPARIKAQNYKFRMPLKPVVAKPTDFRHDVFGVAVNGVPFNPATNEFWNNNRRWNYDALSGKIYLGTDASNAHVQPGGIYHYHGIPNGLVEKLLDEQQGADQEKKPQMLHIGYGSDGFPIYVTYGYKDTNDPESGLKELRSSYRLKEGTRPSGNAGPGGVYDGTFSADWEYVKDAGDLDECNGRTGVTPEYPQGTYYYVLTDEFPFVPRFLRGAPDPSFNPNRPRGPRPGQDKVAPVGRGLKMARIIREGRDQGLDHQNQGSDHQNQGSDHPRNQGLVPHRHRSGFSA